MTSTPNDPWSNGTPFPEAATDKGHPMTSAEHSGDQLSRFAVEEAGSRTGGGPAPDAETLQRVSERLHGLSQKIASFIELQFQRLEQTLRQCQHATELETQAQQRMHDVESRQRQWEEKRKAEMLKLTQEQQQLAEAWQKLESEQRDFASQRDAMQVSGQPVNMLPAAPPLQAEAAGQQGYFPMQPNMLSGSAQTAGPAVMNAMNPQYAPVPQAVALPDEETSNDFALHQFRQLKREIRKHSRRNRREKR